MTKKKESIEIPLHLARILAAEKEDFKESSNVQYDDAQELARACLRLLIASLK